ncbi:hypothetical protein [Kibdelosporangium phytohabitans]|uniref:Uncharacterized protein n=1 Tax=Kibdelosporangium phytohabitans TaxID=860235 RepID=A0A0N9HTF2_9PSEU|nr:hypothetical protein [Kibdelosporangium phytohabitans]ALG10520.1 hypothetical protein AOZ06_29745 [Kibdelosporangium phytohabitans]MBE1461615.1 hypothetical protein [Kibdelosporangium phytohabitans]
MHEGWVVFVDADEWLTERAAGELASRLASVSGLEGLPGIVFAPKIIDEDTGKTYETIPASSSRRARSGSGGRFTNTPSSREVRTPGSVWSGWTSRSGTTDIGPRSHRARERSTGTWVC